MAYEAVAHRFAINAYIIDYSTGENEDYSSILTSVAIKNDFSNKSFQQYRVIFNISNEQEQKLAQTNFYILLKFSRINSLTDSSDENNSSDPIIDKELYSITLRPIDPNKSFRNKVRTDVENNKDELEEARSMIGFDCVPKEELTINNLIINECYSNCNIMEIMINSISSVYTKELYMKESYNTERYEDLLLPPQGLIPTLKYIHNNYGVYRNSFKIYFLPNKLYLYDIFDDDLSDTNMIDIIISQDNEIDGGNEKYTTVKVDENNNIQKYTSNNLPVFSNKDILTYSLGDQIIYNSYDDEFNLISRTKTVNTDLNGNDRKTRYKWNDNRFADFEERDTKVMYYTTAISLTNVDFTLIEPVTKVQISGSTNEILNGIYSILGTEVYFSTNDRKKFNCSTNIFIGKIK